MLTKKKMSNCGGTFFPYMLGLWEKVQWIIHRLHLFFFIFLLGSSDGVVNYLDFCLALLKSLGCFLLPVHTFFTVEGSDSEFVKFTVPTLKAFLKAHFRVCLATSKNFSSEILYRHFFPILHQRAPGTLTNATVAAFVLLHNSRFNFHCYTQREATPTQKSAQKWQLRPFATSCAKDYEGH